MAILRLKILSILVLVTAFTVLVFVQGPSQSALAKPAKGNGGNQPSFSSSKVKKFASGRIIVQLKSGVPKEKLRALNRGKDARIKESIPDSKVSVVDLPSDLSVENAVNLYEKSSIVKHAEPDYLLKPTKTPNDPQYPSLYGLNNTGQTGGTSNADINAPEAWDVTTGSASTIVGVIDTGVDINHPDLRNNIWTNPGETGVDSLGRNKATNGVDDDHNGYVDDVHGWDFFHNNNSVYDRGDGDQHGTHVAGTIAAQGNNGIGVTGVNWHAQIMPLKFIGPTGGYTSDAEAAIRYAIDNGAKITNNSWGGSQYSQTLKDAITAAQNAGVLFVAAAGNNGVNSDASPSYPASYNNSNIISVAATDNRDGLASFSNYGSTTVDLGAPGVGILSTLPGNTYGSYNGTSVASPHVAGVAALIKSANPSLDSAQIKSRILQSVDKVSSLQGKTATGGRLDAARALGLKSTNLVMNTNPRTVAYRSATTLSGRLTDQSGNALGGRTVTLYKRPLGTTASKLSTLTTASDGTYRLGGVRPDKHTYYWARFGGSQAESLEPSSSAASRVNVRAFVNLNLYQENLKLGNRRGMSGRVLPSHAGKAVKIVIKRNGVVIARQGVRLNSNSVYRFVYKPQRTGYYAFYTVFSGDTDHLSSRSPQKAFRVVTVRATVRDNRTNLTKRQIRLYVDGRRRGRFAYDRARDQLRYTTPRLSLGRHVVKIIANDAAGNVVRRSWAFRVVRR